MFCTAAIDETVIGKTLARKIKKHRRGIANPEPENRDGIHAIGEIGRNI